MLKEKKYNILSLQEEKLKVEIEHIELEKIKLQLQISSLNQWPVEEIMPSLHYNLEEIWLVQLL